MGERLPLTHQPVDLSGVETSNDYWARQNEAAAQKEFEHTMHGLMRELDAGTPWSEGWDD